MRALSRTLAAGVLSFGTLTAATFACGTPPPQTPPPPPPDPPIVCCIVIDWFQDPTNPNFECLIVRYFRQDGQPLFQSNPMPLLPNQACACAVPPLPSIALAAGAVPAGLSFGARPIWRGLPPNVPGYNNFQHITNPDIQAQVDSFFDVFAAAAGPTVTPPDTGLSQPFGFSGPGNIPPNQVFDIYQKIRVPRGFDPRVLCIPGQMWMLGLFLIQDGQVLVEPTAPGLPPLPLPQFQQQPGRGAFYKFKWYPFILPPFCPRCPGDTNDDFIVNFADLNNVLSAFGTACPPPPAS